ncbi:hypothetical protein ACS5UA_22630 [Brucella sp. RRSP16]|uniref:hypothetical protein n=1 Tax=Brucella sp. RRSP16 TaxID=3453707 RepID=UPI003FCDBF0F
MKKNSVYNAGFSVSLSLPPVSGTCRASIDYPLAEQNRRQRIVCGELTAGAFVGFLLLLGVFFRPIDKFNSIIESYPKGIAGFQRYTRFLDTRPDIAHRQYARSVERLNGDIDYCGVRFGYTSGRPVLEGLNLFVRTVETVAFSKTSASRNAKRSLPPSRVSCRGRLRGLCRRQPPLDARFPTSIGCLLAFGKSGRSVRRWLREQVCRRQVKSW